MSRGAHEKQESEEEGETSHGKPVEGGGHDRERLPFIRSRTASQWTVEIEGG
jgi:hypothetical protein